MAVTGFAMNGVCYADSAAVFNGFKGLFPVFDGGHTIFYSGISFTAPQTFTLYVKDYVDGSQTFTSGDRTFILGLCDPSLPLNGGVAFDPVLAASFWSFALAFVLASWLFARNAGLILSALKRW